MITFYYVTYTLRVVMVTSNINGVSYATIVGGGVRVYDVVQVVAANPLSYGTFSEKLSVRHRFGNL